MRHSKTEELTDLEVDRWTDEESGTFRKGDQEIEELRDLDVDAWRHEEIRRPRN